MADEERAHWESKMDAHEDESLDDIEERMANRMINHVVGRPKAQAEPAHRNVIEGGNTAGMDPATSPDWLRGLFHITMNYDEIRKEWAIQNLPKDAPAFIVEAVRMLSKLMDPPDMVPARTEAFLRKIPGAVDRARLKHPWSGDRWKALGALTGEVGELANAMNKGEGQDRIEAEALDVIATAVRLVVQG